jgi:transcriptional repressor NF-X1
VDEQLARMQMVCLGALGSVITRGYFEEECANFQATAPNPTPDASLALRPASVAPTLNTLSTSAESSNRGRNSRRGGFGRGGIRGAAATQPLVNRQRNFGGQLTAPSPAASLAGDAPEFIPGKPIAPRPQRQPKQRRMSKSQAPDISTRTHEDITNGQYECVICTNEVLPNSKIWTCRTCWSVLHLSCVKRWSKNEVSTHQQRANGEELPPSRQWRCPGCNLVSFLFKNL